MVSLIDRIDIMTSQNRKAVQAQKSYADLSLWGVGQAAPNHDLRADEYGAAQAVAVVTEVQRAVKFWGNELGGLVHCLYDGNTDKILWKSTERNPPVGRGAMWAKALKRFARETKHGFFESIAFSDWVYGETFIWKRRNQIQASDFMWLNPLATEPYIMMGEIAYYRYQSDDPDRPYQLNTNEIAFHIAQRNPFDDLRGQSPVLTAINDINIVENVKRSLNAYYRNGMSLGGIVSGKPASEGAWTVDGRTLDEIKAEMQRSHKGVRNFYEWLFSNAPIDVHPFEQIDIRKNFEIVAPIRKQIAMAMGVPPVLSGDPTEVNYDNADKVMDNWWQTDGIPYASQVAEFVNDDILPSVEPDSDVYFGFDYSKFEIEDPETVSADFTAGYGEITESQKKRGLKVDAALEGIYIINGKPMHRDIIALIAKQVPPEYAQAAAPVAPPMGAPDTPVTEPQPSSTPLLDTLDSDPVAVPAEPKKHSHSHDDNKAAFLSADDPLSDDLRTWQKFAMKRYKSGDVSKAATFESAVIPPILNAAIRGALQTVSTPDEIYTVFDDADRWIRHDARTH